jgi:protein-L-isoaspartate(D-aspartate) O-methyltransferase
VSTQCPECGFDLEPGKACGVCGYQPRAAAPGSKVSAQGAKVPSTRAGSRSSVGVLIASAAGLLVVLAVFIVVDLGGRAADSDQPSARITVAVPASPPKPVEAAPVQPPPAPAAATAPAEPPVPAPVPSPAPVHAARAAPVAAQVRAKLHPAPQISAETGPIMLGEPGPVFDISSRKESPPVTDQAAFVSWMLSHTDQKEKYLLAKWDRAQVLLRTRNITHPRILEAFLRAPREYFARDARRAYENAALPIGYGQTISGPHMVARMTDYLDPQPDQKVLEIGTGSGYQSAVLSELTTHLYTIEIVGALANETNAIYEKYTARYPEYGNIRRKIDDGYNGWPEHAPFDRIIVTCGIDHVPPELLRELAPEGIMVIPVGPPSGQTILRITKHVNGDGSVDLEREDIYQGKHKEIFVPFTSKGGGLHTAADPKATE